MMKTIHCPRCREQLAFAGEETRKLDNPGIIMGASGVDKGLKIEIYACPKCGKLEFFTPIDKETVIEKTTCSACGKTYDADFPRCPGCGKTNPKMSGAK